jgi:hypothetical protein
LEAASDRLAINGWSIISDKTAAGEEHNIWNVQKFAGTVYNSPPTSGEVKDDALMDL